MSKTYIQQIDSRIRDLQAEIDNLMSAKLVIKALMDEAVPKASVKHPKLKRTMNSQSPLIDSIRDVLTTTSYAITSADIMKGLQMRGTDVKMQRVWSALSIMKKRGDLIHNTFDGTYMLPPVQTFGETYEVQPQAS